MDRAAPREIPGPTRISQPACTPSRSGLPSLPCSHRSDTSFLHTLFVHYTFFPKWRNFSFRRRLPFYVIFILWYWRILSFVVCFQMCRNCDTSERGRSGPYHRERIRQTIQQGRPFLLLSPFLHAGIVGGNLIGRRHLMSMVIMNKVRYK